RLTPRGASVPELPGPVVEPIPRVDGLAGAGVGLAPDDVLRRRTRLHEGVDLVVAREDEVDEVRTRGGECTADGGAELVLGLHPFGGDAVAGGGQRELVALVARDLGDASGERVDRIGHRRRRGELAAKRAERREVGGLGGAAAAAVAGQLAPAEEEAV